MSPPGPRWRPAAAFTVLTEPGAATLVAGEDQRWVLRAPGIEAWFPELWARRKRAPELGEALGPLPPEHQATARELLEGLRGERLLVPAEAAERHAPRDFRLVPEGTGPLVERLGAASGEGDELRVLCQDRLDYAAVDSFRDACREAGVPGLWVSTGPARRGLVSPVQLPGGGACLGCLLGAFRRRSPTPELYDQLRAHAAAGGAVAPAEVPAALLEVLAGLARAKAARLAADPVDRAAFRLHVLELETLEVSSHPVARDPDCPGCGGG